MQARTSVGEWDPKRDESRLGTQFIFEPHAIEPGPSVLYDEHVKRTSKSHIAAFAGYLREQYPA